MKKMIKILVMSLLIIFAVLSCNTKEKKAKIDDIVIKPNPVKIIRGASQEFTALVKGRNITSQAVIWSITGNNSLSTTINSDGLLMVSDDETAVILCVMATSNLDLRKRGTVTANILHPTIDRVVVSPKQIMVEKGTTADFTAVVYGQYEPTNTVTWSITGNSSSFTSINANGQLIVANNETSSTILIQATSTYDSSKVGTATVNVDVLPTNINFGGLVWRILYRDFVHSQALIVTNDIIESMQYNTVWKIITWENCSLRAYLNDEFYHSFSAADQARIQTTVINNNHGNPTSDKIFLLNDEELSTYFYSEANRVANFNGEASWWWSRSVHGANVIGGGSSYFDTRDASGINDRGYIDLNGYSVSSYHGVRPALWLKM